MKINLLKIDGNWDLGYALDKHTISSEFIGYNEFEHPQYDTRRTEIGEAIYQLKYRNDMSQIDPLADIFVKTLKPLFKTAALIVPIPPSKHRITQPLILLSKAVADKWNIPFFENILIKRQETPQVKNIQDRDERRAIMSDLFLINDGIKNEGAWDVLLIDDLYSSGATLTEATKALRSYHKINKIFVGTFTRTN